MARSGERRRRVIVIAIRWGLPLALVVLGVVCILLGHGHINNVSGSIPNTDSGSSVMTSIPTGRDSMYSAIGVSALIVALMVWMIGWMLRMNVTDGYDRAREEAARDYFARTGRWPGERGPGASQG